MQNSTTRMKAYQYTPTQHQWPQLPTFSSCDVFMFTQKYFLFLRSSLIYYPCSKKLFQTRKLNRIMFLCFAGTTSYEQDLNLRLHRSEQSAQHKQADFKCCRSLSMEDLSSKAHLTPLSVLFTPGSSKPLRQASPKMPPQPALIRLQLSDTLTDRPSNVDPRGR